MTDAFPDARFRRSPTGAVALTVVAVGLGGWGIANSPLFHTKRIHVDGVRHLSTAEVVDAAGIGPRANLIRLSVDAVSAEVERLPWVADAAADRDLPSTLRIRVVERTPVGWFRVPEGSVLVARDGTVLAHLGGRPPGIPAVGSLPASMSPGQRVSGPPATFGVAASMDHSLRRAIRTVAQSEDGIELHLRVGGTVRYGPPSRLGEKNERLAALLRWTRRNGVEVEAIDLRVPDAPSLAPVEQGTPSPRSAD
jgi:cell division protein FtsQ